ncbi:midnolin [Melopsittacus undulatus]|uniref:midnolin n=1 Tax=Melopsittacus undulatus TaxID=13146 RepID=UPI00146A5E93|nr:midnolin [Melopsittacus undulatus]XP_033926638.1 midnolin [Melopsittacus undulatus]XP_033926639.1 midnolin [Melopsittacus undulatus]
MDPQPGARSCTRGAPACEVVPNEPPMNLYINTTTGTRYELSVPAEETVEGLKRRLSQRLKVPKERLALLHKESRLSSGKLQDLGVVEGSKLTLVPTVEAGLMSQASRPEQSVMQALESLTETQVNDFLSGRSPLTLALRVGDHMMFVQLQLAAQQSSGQLQHRHLIASRGEPGAAASPHCRTLHGGTGSGFTRIPVVPASCQQSPAPSPAPPAPAPPMYCNTPHAAPVTAGMFRSHGASTQTVNSSVVSSCSEVECGTRSSSSPSSSPAPAARSRKPGAVIESFVNHAPGVFSGTFSGTLHPNCQDSSGRPRRDIGTILQILNDLLSATRHYQGMPQSLTQLRCQTQFSSSSSSSPPASPDLATKTTSEPLPAAAASPPLHPVVQCQSQIRMCKPSGDRLRQTENRATRCKVERLQLLMQQKRLRRKARRDARAPYHWLPNRKSSRTNSNSSVSSEGSLDLDFEDSVWKPEVKADMKSEFVVA